MSSFGIVSKGCTSLFGSLEECLLLESFQRDVHLLLEVYTDVALTEYLETSSSPDRMFPFTIRCG